LTAPTHITFGQFVYLLLLTTTGVALNTVNAMIIAIASILPDIDTAASLVGRSFPFLSERIERKFGHRTLTHSVAFIAGLALVLSPLYFLSPDEYVCFLVGYSTHPFLDTMTVHGVKLFYPLSTVKCVFPLEVNNPHRYRMQTGSRIDKLLGLLFLIACIPTFLIANQGYERFIRTTQKNVESAVRDYNDFSRDHFVYADIVAYNMMTKKRVQGIFEIVGTLNSSTLLFKDTTGALHSLGREYQAEFVAEKIVCLKGDPAETIVKSVDMSNQLLLQILDHLDLRYECHMFGALSSNDPFTVPQENRLFSPVSGSFSTIRFNYATYNDIQQLGLENTFISQGMLTIRTVTPKAMASDSPFGKPRTEPHSFVQLSFRIDLKENIEFAVQKGDTISEKDLLIKRDLALFYDQQIMLSQQKISALEDERELRLSELDQQLSETKDALQKDSAKNVQMEQLVGRGFVTQLRLDEARREAKRAMEEYANLLSSRKGLLNNYSIRIRKLQNDLTKLRSKEKAASKQSEIRSTIGGIIHDIRQIYHNNKLQITFVIQKSDKQ
jgi:inner membrane protein